MRKYLAGIIVFGMLSVAGAVSVDSVLSVKNGAFFFEGKPFGEISFNKFDLFWELWDEAYAGRKIDSTNSKYRLQKDALKELHELGFRSIRIFALPFSHSQWRQVYEDSAKRKTVFYASLDTALALCDRYNIRVVYSLTAGSFTDNGWTSGNEQTRELIADSLSKSRQRLYHYIDDVVTRYRNRRTVFSWEISNELTLIADIAPDTKVYNGERMPTLKDVANFYRDVTLRIKANDPVRLVNNGGSLLRESAWNQYANNSFQTDNLNQQTKAFEMLFTGSPVDIMDIHYYFNSSNKDGYTILDNNGGNMLFDLGAYQEMARTVGKPFMVGEYGTLPSAAPVPAGYFGSYADTAARTWVRLAIDNVLKYRVPLVYWWCYQSDRDMDQNQTDRFDIDLQRDSVLVKMFADGNRALQAEITRLNSAPPSVELTSGSNNIMVRNVVRDAWLRLYNADGTLLSFVKVSDSDAAKGSLTITNVVPGASYYVVQAMNNIPSAPSNSVYVGATGTSLPQKRNIQPFCIRVQPGIFLVGGVGENQHVHIYDRSGHMIKNLQGKNDFLIDLKMYAKGVYYAAISTMNGKTYALTLLNL